MFHDDVHPSIQVAIEEMETREIIDEATMKLSFDAFINEYNKYNDDMKFQNDLSFVVNFRDYIVSNMLFTKRFKIEVEPGLVKK